MAECVIQRLTSPHDRTAFSCGKAPLDTFLVTLVSQYEKRRLGRTFVATEPGQTRVAAFRGKRLGETLLLHALRNALSASETLGAFAVDVWAVDDDARAFYERYGFVPLEDNPSHLYLPMNTVDALLGP